MPKVNHVDRRHFDRKLANIRPCNSADHAYSPSNKALYFFNLYPTHGFQWDREIMGEEDDVEEVRRLCSIGWGDEDSDHV